MQADQARSGTCVVGAYDSLLDQRQQLNDTSFGILMRLAKPAQLLFGLR